MIKLRGHLQTTSYDVLREALAACAARFKPGYCSWEERQDEELLSVDIDETQTVSIPADPGSDVPSRNIPRSVAEAIWTAKELTEISKVNHYLLEVHGIAPGKKGDGITRLLYENGNVINSRIMNNDKLDKARQLIDDLEADIVAYNEHRQNLRQKEHKNGFRQLFNGGETDLCAVALHNTHENVGKWQEGGTALLAYGPLLVAYDAANSGADELGLGRWSFMRFVGSDGVVTRVITGYVPTANNKKDSGTSYQQHRRF